MLLAGKFRLAERLRYENDVMSSSDSDDEVLAMTGKILGNILPKRD
jgi:hypothetical protein